MKITSQQYASALYDAVHQTAEKDHDLVLDNFVKVLAQNGDLSKHAEIEKEYRVLEMKDKGIQQAEVTVAREIEVNKEMINSLNAILRGSSSHGERMTLSATTKIDESLIGGLVVRVDDTLIDASVRGQLNKLNQSLKT